MLQLLTVGRIRVDLYADAARRRASPIRSASRSRSAARPPTWPSRRRGSATAAAVLTKVGADPFGDYVVAKLTGVRRRHPFVGVDPVAAHAVGVRRDDAAGGSGAAVLPPAARRRTCSSRSARSTTSRVARGPGAVGRRVGDGARSPARTTVTTAARRRGAGGVTPCSTSTTAPPLWPDEPTAARGHRRGGRRGDRGRRQPGRVRGRRRHRPTRTRPRDGLLARGVGGGDRQARRRRGARRHRRRAQHRRRPPGRGGVRPRRRRRVRRGARARAARRVGAAAHASSTPTRPERSWPSG